MLFRRVRVNGKLVLSEPAKAYTPGRGVYRSAYKNAMRLARTEMARAYSEGTIRYGQSKDWIDGWIWRNGGPAEDIPCQEDGTFFPKSDPPTIPVHPNCMCFLELHIKGE